MYSEQCWNQMEIDEYFVCFVEKQKEKDVWSKVSSNTTY